MNYFFGDSQPAWHNRKLRVRIGPSLSTLSTHNVNKDSDPHFIDSPYFVGHVCVRVKNFNGITPSETEEPIPESAYFGSRKRLFSVQVQGRFKHEYSAEDILFGAEFEKKVNPPTGISLALKFANYIDPALQADVNAERPWLYSPMLCAMNIVNVVKAPSPVIGAAASLDKLSVPLTGDASKETSLHASQAGPVANKEAVGSWSWGGAKELVESNALLVSDPPFEETDIAERRKYFNVKDHREAMKFSPENVYNLEIFAPFMDFNKFDLSLGLNINVLRYILHQPIRLICKSGSTNIPFFVIEFDLIPDPNASDSLAVPEASSTGSKSPRSGRRTPEPK
jgi:hypothetical protein